MTELNEQQRQAIKDHPEAPVVLLDPSTQSRYVLVPADTYDRVRALVAEDEFHVDEAYPLMDSVAANAGWNDPSLDAYEQLDTRRNP